MRSLLERLSDFVMLVSHKENKGKWLDVLAVVEAARILVENQKGGKMNPLAWDSLDKALAKLDEVQP